MTTEYKKLINEDTKTKKDCPFCSEQDIAVGQKTSYGSYVVYKVGEGKDGWFATISPKVGSSPNEDFTLQLMTKDHLTHFSQISKNKNLAKNYGIAFSILSSAMTMILSENPNLKSVSDERDDGIAVATYAKCTTWKDKKEHLHIKIYPFRGDLSQPSPVDSSFGRKEVFKDIKTGEEYVKFDPVIKKNIPTKRFEEIKDKLIDFFNKNQ